MVFMKEFFEKVDFEKKQMTKKHEKFPRGQTVNYVQGSHRPEKVMENSLCMVS